MPSTTNPSDSFSDPRGSFVEILTDEAILEDARQRLRRAGFGADGCEGWHGELARTEVDGAAYRKGGAMPRQLQAVLSDDADQVRRYAEHLRAGHYVLGVSVRDDQAAKQRAVDALRAAHAESVRYYAKTPSRSYPPTSERAWAKRGLAGKAFES